MAYWLFKTEPFVFSLQDLQNAPHQTTHWEGIRNYQARNFLRDRVCLHDSVLFYHSRCEVPSVVGLATVVREAYPDHTAWNPDSAYHDPKASPENPRWFMVDVKFKLAFEHPVSLQEMKANPELSGMLVVRPGQRLSIQPVEDLHFLKVCSMAGV